VHLVFRTENSVAVYVTQSSNTVEKKISFGFFKVFVVIESNT